MSEFRTFISKNSHIAESDSKIFFSGSIPDKKLNNAISSYGFQSKTKDVILLIDDTVFGSAKDGLLITDHHICAKEAFESPWQISLDTISSVKMDGGRLIINNKPVYKFNLAENKSLSLIFSGLDVIIKSTFANDTNRAEYLSSPDKNLTNSFNSFAKNSFFYDKWNLFVPNLSRSMDENLLNFAQDLFILHDKFFADFYASIEDKSSFTLIANDNISVALFSYYSVTAKTMLFDHVDEDTLNTVLSAIIQPVLISAANEAKNQKPSNIAEAANPNSIIKNTEKFRYFRECLDHYGGIGSYSKDPEWIYRCFGSRIHQTSINNWNSLSESDKNSTSTDFIREFSEGYAKNSTSEIESNLINLLENMQNRH
jgi:hypothetical protein